MLLKAFIRSLKIWHFSCCQCFSIILPHCHSRCSGDLWEAAVRCQMLRRGRRSCGEVLEAVTNFLIVDFLSNSIRLRPCSEISFFPRLHSCSTKVYDNFNNKSVAYMMLTAKLLHIGTYLCIACYGHNPGWKTGISISLRGIASSAENI